MNTTMKKAPEREEIETLLPWYAAGTLNRRDTARVEQALASDKELARQFEMVRDELGETIVVNESLGAPSQRAMKSLFEKIDAEPARAPAAASFNLMGRITEFMSSLTPRTLAYAGGAAAIALMLQAGVIGTLIGERTGTAPNLASAPATMTAASQGVEALVQFTPQANAAEIAEFLNANKASIVGGPANGLFRVRVPAQKEQAAEIVKKLGESKVISLALPATN
jgi:anti-sigma-K factor RskA